MTRSDALALAVAVLAGCDASFTPGSPRPTSVAPAIAFATADVILEIVGDDFEVEAVQGADRGGSRVDATYRAWLGAVELLDVTWIDAHTLRARVAAGLPVGTYDLAVQGPHGQGTLPGAYQVVAGTLGTLGVSMSSPLQVAVGEELQVTVQAANTGTSLVRGVVPDVVVSGAGAVQAVAVTAPAQDLSVGQAYMFTLRYRAVQAGAVSLQVSVDGTDPRTGGSVAASTSAQVAISPPLAAQVVAADPFADGSSFAFVVGYGGEVYVGPSRAGIGLIRMQPDGSLPQSLALSFPRDTSGNLSSSTAPPPYASVGYTGCAQNTSTGCGPDNEDGRGLLASVRFAGDEWLVVGGARSGGNLEYVYMTRSTTSPLAFSYVDLSAILGSATRGFSAALAASAGDRLYLGFPDNGGNRPYGIELLHAPSPGSSGLDAVLGSDVRDLGLHEVYDKKVITGAGESFASTGISMVDAISEVGGRVYFFNDVGCAVATTATPVSKDDFVNCSPAAGAAYLQSDSVEPTKQFDLEPHERAWPAATPWNGKLYAIRNTSTGPQLWACDPSGGADPSVCDRTDWRLVAADGNLRTRFGNATASAATLLLATPTHLYVGFDDPTTGLHVFRTGVPAPAVASDFSGKDGCVAGNAGCEGIGGDGFGVGPALSRIFDAKAIPLGDGFEVVISAGDGSSPVRIVRIAP